MTTAPKIVQNVPLYRSMTFLQGCSLQQNPRRIDRVPARMRTSSVLSIGSDHERMPVLLTKPADFETWLSGSTEEAFKLARSYAADQMRIVQSGSERKDLLKAA